MFQEKRVKIRFPTSFNQFSKELQKDLQIDPLLINCFLDESNRKITIDQLFQLWNQLYSFSKLKIVTNDNDPPSESTIQDCIEYSDVVDVNLLDSDSTFKVQDFLS